MSRIALSYLGEWDAYLEKHKDDMDDATRTHLLQVVQAIRTDLVTMNAACLQVAQEYQYATAQSLYIKTLLQNACGQAESILQENATLLLVLQQVCRQRDDLQQQVKSLQMTAAAAATTAAGTTDESTSDDDDNDTKESIPTSASENEDKADTENVVAEDVDAVMAV